MFPFALAMPAIINDIFHWYQTSGIQDAVITIPLAELLIIFLLLTICLFFRLARTGLIIAYLFIYYRGWFFCLNNDFLGPNAKNLFLTGYIVFGILALTLTVIAMTLSRRASPND